MTPALPETLPPHVRAAVLEAKAGLEAVYGDRLARVVLYGSYARGEAGPDSDVDLLVALRGEVRPYTEIKRTGALALDLFLRHDADVSIQPYAEADVSAGERPFLREVTSHGIAL